MPKPEYNECTECGKAFKDGEPMYEEWENGKRNGVVLCQKCMNEEPNAKVLH